jgi:hypothetical protein
LRNLVLTPQASNAPARQALLRALERFPATIEETPAAARGSRLLELAADPEVEFIVIVDDDAVLQPAAFGALRRAFGPGTAIVGGRALVDPGQRFGDMFGPARSGPNPFELVPIVALQTDRYVADLVRGPIDVPQRGAFVVTAAFIRSLGAVALDPVLLHLELAVRARAQGAEVVCEPSLIFAASDDPLPLRRALADVRRFAQVGSWDTEELHRDPPRLRSVHVSREVRVMGNIRGYARQPYPPIDVLALAGDEMARARVLRAATPLAVNGAVTACDPGDGDALRRALGRTGERYLLVAAANAMPDRARIEALAERLERSGRVALALENATPPYGAALFHCGRLVNAAAFEGASVGDVIAAAVTALPKRRSFAASPDGRIVPEALPPFAGLGQLDLVFVAASKPAVTEQTVRAALGESVAGTITAIYPAGAATTGRMLGGYTAIRLAPDASDVQLAVGLNRALGSCTSDGIAIVRDDAQLPHGVLERLADAFRRIPGLGIAVPRVGGNDRPESLPDLGYRSSAEMQLLYDRRAEAFAREATLLEVATAPVMVVSREALDVVGGFDESFGFSRIGVEDFSRRVRAANFSVACCEDAYAHLFPAADAQSLVGNLDGAPFLRAAYEKRWSARRGFDAQTDRVPLRTGAAPEAAPAASETVVRILFPLGDEDEWLRAKPLLAALAATFRTHDPLEVAVGLDGTFELQAAVSALRELLIASTVPMEETINVTIDNIGDLAAWRDANANSVRAAGLERELLAELPAVADIAAVRARLADPAR